MEVRLKTRGVYTDIITLALVKNYLRVEDTNDDALLNSLIAYAVQSIENHTRKALTLNTYVALYSSDEIEMKGANYSGDNYPDYIKLPRGRVKDITTVETISYQGVASPFTGFNFDADLNIFYFTSAPFGQHVKITYRAGLEPSNDLAIYQAAILSVVSYLYEKRDGTFPDMSATLDNLLSGQKDYII